MRAVTIVLLCVNLVLAILNLISFDADTAKSIHIATYAAVLLPLWTGYKTKSWSLVSLLITVAVIHIMQETCTDYNACVSGFGDDTNTALATQEINNVLTLFALMSLFSSVAESASAVSVLNPLLLMAAVLGLFMGKAALFLVLVSLFTLVRAMMQFSKYNLVDFLIFISSLLATTVFFFVDNRGQFFVFLSMAFASATQVENASDSHVFGLISRGASRLIQKAQEYGAGAGLARVDLA